jgi:Flp pilus assembly protein TadD
VASSPNKSRSWNNLGVAYSEAGARERARTAFERALTLDALNDKARQNLDDLD